MMTAAIGIFDLVLFLVITFLLAYTACSVSSLRDVYADSVFIFLFNLVFALALHNGLCMTLQLFIVLYGTIYTWYWTSGYQFATYKRQLYAQRQQRRAMRQPNLAYRRNLHDALDVTIGNLLRAPEGAKSLFQYLATLPQLFFYCAVRRACFYMPTWMLSGLVHIWFTWLLPLRFHLALTLGNLRAIRRTILSIGWWLLCFALEPLLVPIYYVAWKWHYNNMELSTKFWAFWFTPVYPPDGFPMALQSRCRPFLLDYARHFELLVSPWFLQPQSLGDWFPGLESLSSCGIDINALAPHVQAMKDVAHQKLILQILFFVASAIQCKTPTHLATTVALALNGMTSTGLVNEAIAIYEKMCLSHAQDMVFAPNARLESWETMRNVVDGWAEARNSELVGRIEKAIHLMVHVGLAKRLGFELSEDSLTKSFEETKKLHSKPDMLLFMAQTILHIKDVLAHYTSDEGSWRSLFRTYGAAKEVDVLYNEVISRQEMYFNGGLAGIQSSEPEYLEKLERCLKELQRLHAKGSFSPMERKIIADRLLRVSSLDSLVRLKSSQSTIRIAPFVLKVSGPTSQGKSVAVDEYQAHILRENGFPTDRIYSCSINENDSFDSNIKNNTVCVRMDDFPKIMPQFAKTNPVDAVMRISNNERVCAVKAELEQKGTVFFNNKLLIISTNEPSMLCGTYAVAPEAVMRRISVHVHMEVKPEFRNERGYFCPVKYRAKVDELGGKLPDSHHHTVQVWKPSTEANTFNARTGVFETLRYTWPEEYKRKFGYRDGQLYRIGSVQFLHYLGIVSREHFAHQEKLVVSNEHHFTATRCSQCYLPSTRCACPPSPSLRLESLDVASARVTFNRLHGWSTAKLQAAYDSSSAFGWYYYRALAAVSRRAIRTSENIYTGLCGFALVYNTISHLCHYIVYRPYSTLAVYLAATTTLSFVPLLSMAMVMPWPLAWFLLQLCLYFLLRPMIDYVSSQSSLVVARERSVKRLMTGVSALVVLAGLIYTWRMLGTDTIVVEGSTQGGAVSTDAVRRYPDDVISGLGVRAVPQGALNATLEQALPIIHRSVACVALRSQGREKRCYGLAYKSNLLLVNNHSLYFGQGESRRLAERMQLTFGPAGYGGNMKEIDISKDDIVEVMESDGRKTDLAIVHLGGGGSRYDLTRFMPEKYLVRGLTTERRVRTIELTRDWDDGKDRSTHMVTQAVKVRHEIAGVGSNAWIYALSEDRPEGSPTYEGLCGAVMLTVEGGKPQISALHFLGSESGVGPAFATQINAPLLRAAENALIAKSPGRGPSIETPLALQCFAGSEVRFTNSVHHKSVVNSLPADAEVRIIGDSTLPRATPRTQIKDRMMKDAVLAHCKGVVEDSHEPPSRLGDPEIYTESLKPKVDCSRRVPTKYLNVAIHDINARVDAILSRTPFPQGPLDDKYILPGKAGVRGMESMKLNTSLGIPFKKKKSTVMSRGENPMPCGTMPITMKDECWKEFWRLDAMVRSGVRPGLAFNAAAKDELVKKGKAKVRVFSGAPLYLGMLVRKYFLPFIAWEMEDPLLHEMAVGINPMGKEWTRMAEHVSSLGRKRAIACDFGQFDASMRYQITRATFNIYIRIAQRSSHFTAEDVRAMQVIAEEICCAVTDYNGTFVELMQSFPSGHNLTVHLNNLANRILHRVAFYNMLDDRRMANELFYSDALSSDDELTQKTDDEFSVSVFADIEEHIHPDLWPLYEYAGKNLFHHFVHLVCYGDDMCGTVAPETAWYNCISVARYLTRFGYTYTNANKEIPTVPFQDWSEIDFLKRRFVHDPANGRWLAPLAWTSITKPLLMGVPPKPSTGMGDDEVCAQIIGTGPGRGQLAEAYMWGEEKYTALANGLSAAMAEVGLLQYCEGGRLPTYAEQHEVWMQRFEDGGETPFLDDGVFDASDLDGESDEFYYDADLILQSGEIPYNGVVMSLHETMRRRIVSADIWNHYVATAYCIVVPTGNWNEKEWDACVTHITTYDVPYIRYVFVRLPLPVNPETILLEALRRYGPPVVITAGFRDDEAM